MKYRQLDKNGDYTFGVNNFLLNKEALAQAIYTRLKLLYNEWWENTEDGLPLFESILGVYGGKDKKQAVDLIISTRILETTGVKELKSYSSIVKDRKYNAICIIDSVFGELELTIDNNISGIEVIF